MCESYEHKKDIYCFEVKVFDEILCNAWVTRPDLFTPRRKNYPSSDFLIFFLRETCDENE